MSVWLQTSQHNNILGHNSGYKHHSITASRVITLVAKKEPPLIPVHLSGRKQRDKAEAQVMS